MQLNVDDLAEAMKALDGKKGKRKKIACFFCWYHDSLQDFVLVLPQFTLKSTDGCRFCID